MLVILLVIQVKGFVFIINYFTTSTGFIRNVTIILNYLYINSKCCSINFKYIPDLPPRKFKPMILLLQ